MRRNLTVLTVLILGLCLSGTAIGFFLPSVYNSLTWRVDEMKLRIQYAFHPPQKTVFVPRQQNTTPINPVARIVLPSSTPAPISTFTPTQPGSTATPAPTQTQTATTTPLPGRVDLKGVRYEDQHVCCNYCAPANLSMALSFWGWQGNRDVVAPALKPDKQDKNVMPYEMVDYVENHTDLAVAYRLGGDLDLIKRFLAAGFPVLLEKGTYLRDLTGVVSWMGHFQVVTGYDDPGGYFIAQDSFVKPDHQVPFDQMIEGWRAFNYTYLVIYPPEKEAQVVSLLGSDADEITNYQNAALKASNEIFGLSGIDQYFAWFNRGASLVKLEDYAGAAGAFDEAFKVYPSIPEADRPWRMLWYNTGPYFAYYGVGRYYDLLYLADGTLNAMQGEKNLEESYYWRGMARAALGDTAAAIEDFQSSLKYHPDFEPAIYQLRLLGVENP